MYTTINYVYIKVFLTQKWELLQILTMSICKIFAITVRVRSIQWIQLSKSLIANPTDKVNMEWGIAILVSAHYFCLSDEIIDWTPTPISGWPSNISTMEYINGVIDRISCALEQQVEIPIFFFFFFELDSCRNDIITLLASLSLLLHL